MLRLILPCCETLLALIACGDPVFHEVRGAEGQNAAGVDGNFLASLWVATDAGRFLADREGSEGRDFDLLSCDQRVGDMLEHTFDKLRAVIARQADFAKDCFAQIHTCKCFFAHNYSPVWLSIGLREIPSQYQWLGVQLFSNK